MQCLLNSQWTLRSYLNKYILQKKTKLTYLRFWVKVDLLRLLNCNMAIALSLSDLKNHIAVFHPHFLLTSLSVCVLLGSRGIIDTLISESKNVHMKIILSVLQSCFYTLLELQNGSRDWVERIWERHSLFLKNL